MTIFNTLQKYDPYFVGFRNIFDRLAEFDTNQPSSNYPPYNIIQDGEKYIFELAVAGDQNINKKVIVLFTEIST